MHNFRYEIRKFQPISNLHLVIAACDDITLARHIAESKSTFGQYTEVWDCERDKVITEYHTNKTYHKERKDNV